MHALETVEKNGYRASLYADEDGDPTDETEGGVLDSCCGLWGRDYALEEMQAALDAAADEGG
jgi:hypothetical protein